jgi:hypothetical protein
VNETSLGNYSIAQATLRSETNIFGPLLYRIITDYRQHTFLDALGSIGGLLAAFQGLHILIFGRPLWWGFIGTQLCLFNLPS